MREFIYFSRKARTSGNWKDNDLMKAGRMDIVCHFIIHSFFVSNAIRNNVKLHLIFYGAPDPPKHLEIENAELISKKDISGLIKRMLYKYRKRKKTEVFPGCFIEKRDLLSVVKELQEKGKDIYILDKRGIDIKKAKINQDNSVFIIGDQEGLLPREKKLLKKGKGKVMLISMGNVIYLATQALIMLQGELDRL